MAREVLGVAGAAVGAYFGGPVGAQIGYAIGSAIGGAIDPPHIDGPKLGDASVQTSRDGVPIPIAWGIIHVVGNIIQINPIVETTKKVSSGKGGGPTTTETIRTRTFAIGICRTIEGPIGGMLRVWENNKLIYDVREGSTFPAADNTAFEGATTLYRGTETQLPDSELETHTGVGNTPAYRALAYIVFNNKDITNFGSSIPSYRFEIGPGLGNCSVVWSIDTITPDLHVGGQDTTTGVWNGDVITGTGVLKDARVDNIYVTNDTNNYTIYAGFNPGVEDGVAEVFFPGCQWYNYSGPKLRGSMTHTNNLADASWNKILTPVVTYDQIGIAGTPNTASRLTDDNVTGSEAVWKFGTANAVPSLSEEPVTTRFIILKEASAPHYSMLRWANRNSPFEDIEVIFNAQTGSIILGASTAPNPAFEVRDNGDWWEVYLQCDPNGIITPTSNTGQVVIYPAWNTDGTAVPDITATGSITVGNVDFYAEQSTGVNGMTISNVRGSGTELKPSTVGSVIDQSRVYVDSANHDDSEGGYYIEWRPLYSHSEIDDDIEILSLNDAAGLLHYDYSTQLLTATDGTNTATVPLTLVKETKYRVAVIWGDFLRVGVDSVWGTAVAYDSAFAGGSDLTICRNPLNVNYWRELRGYHVTYTEAFDEITILMSAIADETVGGITRDLCGIVDVTDVDTTQVDTILVRGFLAAGGYNSADTIRALQRAYFFDLPEIDGELVAILRGGASVETIGRDDMVIGSEAELETAREQGVEFPQKLHLAYANAETDYTPTKETSERRSAQVKALSEISIEVPINLEADEAAQITDKMHKVAWAELEGRVKFGVSEKLAKLVPSDPVMVETSTGVYKRVRIQKINSVDGMVQIDGVVDRVSAYSSAATAPIGVDPIEPGSNLISDTTYEIMDLPALLQSHDTLHVYVSAYGSDSGPWSGAIVEQLLDTEWIERGRVTFPETMGVLAADLASHPRGLDTTNTITVTLSDDDVATITQAEFDLGGNAALVGDEIINFRDVVANGDDWDLSYLNRAAMNTFQSAHTTGDRFVKLVAPTRIELSSAFLNESLTFRCYSIGNVPSASDETTFTFVGYSQIEWTPLNATKELVDGDWLISWDHNERIGAPNETVVSQHFLDFRVQFIESPFSFTFPTTNETLTYTEAEQIEDFGAPVADFDQILIYANNRYTGFGVPATPSVLGATFAVDNDGDLTTGLLAVFDLGDASDSTGNIATGTDTNVVYGAQKLGDGATFNGATSEINFGNVLDFERTESRSWSFWLKGIVEENKSIMGKGTAIGALGNGWNVHHNVTGGGNGQIFLLLYNDDGSTGMQVSITNADIDDGNLHHCVITYDGTSLASGVLFYIDGSLESKDAPAIDTLAGTISNSANCYIGSDSNGSSFNGSLDQMIVWSRVLSVQNVEDMFNSNAGNVFTP